MHQHNDRDEEVNHDDCPDQQQQQQTIRGRFVEAPPGQHYRRQQEQEEEQLLEQLLRRGGAEKKAKPPLEDSLELEIVVVEYAGWIILLFLQQIGINPPFFIIYMELFADPLQ